MRRLLHLAGFLLAVAPATGVAAGQESVPKPYHDPRQVALTYNGPGRDDPDPTGLSEIRIGYFGPADASHPDGGQLWAGASLAIEEANRQGGYRGLPFRLIPAWSENPWAGGVADLARITYDQKVWAIIGGIDGGTTHLAEQVVAKAQLTLINPAATDRSIHTAGVPWMFSCVPGDGVLAEAIGRELRQRAKSFSVISATDHDSRAFEAQIESVLAREHLVPLLHAEWTGGSEGPARIAREVAGSAPEVIVVIAPTRDSVHLIDAIRNTGFAGDVLTDARVARAPYESSMGRVMYPVLGDISSAFRERFRVRWGRDPDYTAAHAYDAASIIVAAVRGAGLNRPRIRDAVRALSPIHGVTGTIELDAQGQNRTEVSLHVLSVTRDVPAARR